MVGFVDLYRGFEKFLLEIDVCFFLYLMLGIRTNITYSRGSFCWVARSCANHVVPALECVIHPSPFVGYNARKKRGSTDQCRKYMCI